MSEFFDREALESEGSEDEEVRRELKRAKKAKKNKKSNVESDEDEEEEDDDDDRIREEMKDLINDDIEEEDSEDDIGRGNKRLHEDELEEDLEDDDYDLIEENLGRRIDRKKKFRRVRRLEDDDEDDEEERPNAMAAREAIANELFDDDEEDLPQQANVSNRNLESMQDRFGDLDSEQSESEDDNFIVDDNDQPIASRPRHKNRSQHYKDQALQQAQDIFGVDFDFDEINNYEEFDEELEDEEYGEEGIEERAQDISGKKKRKRIPKKSIFELYEPAELERSHLTTFDNEVRSTDLPERFQLRAVPVLRCESNEIREESEWIYKNLYEMLTITRQDKNASTSRQPLAGSKSRSVIFNIQQVLHFIRNDLLEVPFISYYRKEYYSPELTISDLWLIYRWDEKWCQLQERKKNLLKLFENIKEYQLSIILKNQDQPLPDDFRRVTDRDLKRSQAIQSFEEFNDCYVQFQLYYSQILGEMKKFLIEQKREKRAREKSLKRQQKQKSQEKSYDENGEELDNENIEEASIEPEDQEDEEENIEDFELSERLNFLKLSIKRDTYLICQEFGVGKLAAKFGLTPEQFGEHVSEAYHKHEIEQCQLDPMEEAQQHISKRFDTADKVLQAATFMVGKQLACDPLFRKTVRQVYYERAKVTVKPTKRGKKEIDESHICYAFKYLWNKPVASFVGDQFIQLNLAVKEGLLEMKLLIDDEEQQSSRNNKSSKHVSNYLDEIKFFYHRDEFSNNVQNWNTQRTKAIEIALTRFLYPYLLKEMTTRILSESQFTIVQHCARKFSSYLAVAPYEFRLKDQNELKNEYEEFDTRNGIRIMGVAFTPGNEEASYCSIIDNDGEVTDYLKLEYFMLKRSEGFLSEKERHFRLKDRDKLKKFIYQKKPHVIALGCDTIVTRNVMDELQSIARELHDDENFPLISVEYVDSELSTVYMNSKRANADFHTYPLKLRQSISLARRIQDPLNEFSQLCTADEEILCLKLHPLQDNIPKEEFLNALYAEFVNRVNEVGVDINRCLVHPHTASLIQFIGGLGPRKGAYLLRTLKKQQTPLLENRTQLVQNCNIGKVVFINCAGFIKIDINAFVDSGTDTYIEVLDSTRVHPEAYEWARKMAVDALDYDEDNDTNPAQALEEIIDNPEKLRDLDLDEFAKELKRQGLGLKKQTLYDIRTELTDRYQDKRKSYKSPSDEEVFFFLTGESLETLTIGKLMQVRVTGVLRRKPKSDQVDNAQPIRMDQGQWKCPFCLKDDFPELSNVWNHFDHNQCLGQPFGVRVRSDNGLTGLIPLKFLSDKDVTDPLTRVKLGMTINCRILKVIVEKFSLELTCRTSDLVDSNNRYKLPKDHYYDFENEDRDIQLEEEKKKRNSRQRTYMKRIIVHPSFHNIDFKKSEQILNEYPQGEAVIRPSSIGNDHLTLSWKVHDGIHQHIAIREEGKTNAFSLGRQLFIDKESFEDLDEIIARHVQPMAAYARDMINFKYFRDLNGDRHAAEKVLNEEKQKAPSRIPYIISASKEFPGKFLLSYQPNQKPFHEYITLTPDGFKYRINVFKSINALFKWFKAHFNDRSTFPRTPGPPTPVSSSPYAVSQRTPVPQTSPFVGNVSSSSINNNKQPSFAPTPTINSQAVQRAAASMPNHIFNTLSRVAGQQATQPSASFNPPFHHPTNFQGPNFSSRSNMYSQQMPPPNSSMRPPQMNSFQGPPRNSSIPPPSFAPNLSNGRPGSRGGNQWADIIQNEWQNPATINHSGRGPSISSMPYTTPGASSSMSISPMIDEATPNILKGDQTPLVDE